MSICADGLGCSASTLRVSSNSQQPQQQQQQHRKPRLNDFYGDGESEQPSSIRFSQMSLLDDDMLEDDNLDNDHNNNNDDDPPVILWDTNMGSNNRNNNNKDSSSQRVNYVTNVLNKSINTLPDNNNSKRNGIVVPESIQDDVAKLVTV